MENQKNLNEVEVEEIEVEEIEGYNYCGTVAHQCLHDCFGSQIFTPNN